MREKDEALERATTLLRATRELLQRQQDDPCVLNLLAETVFYDEAECDGACLLDDIDALFDEWGIDI